MARVAIGLVLLCDTLYVIGLLTLGSMPDFDGFVNIGLRLGPIWSPAIVFWVAAAYSATRRLPVVLAALAVTSWAVGDTLYDSIMGPAGFVTSPAPTDIGYLGFYVFMLAALIALIAPQAGRSVVPLVLEGAVAALGAASVLLVIVQPVIDSAAAQPLTATTALNITYPLLDVAVVAITAGYATNSQLAGSSRAWWFVAGIVVFVAADVGYAFLSDDASYSAGAFIDLGWPLGLALLALWVVGFIAPPRAERPSRYAASLGYITPGLAVFAALGVLVYASQQPVHLAGVVTAVLTVALAAIPVITRQALLARLLRGEERVVAQLRELDASKSEMMATLNHELRTPLTSILGYVELVRDGAGGVVPGGADDMLGAVEHNAQRLNAIVDEMLLLTRLDARGLALTLVRLDLRVVIRRIVDTLQPVATQRNIELTLALPEEAVEVLGDEVRLGHAATTIVENALKFTGEGGQVSVALSVAPEAPAVALSVVDTGMGIPADEVPHLFDRFFRASNARSSGVNGSGLGLSIAEGVVNAHGGRIDVTSTLGVGTTMVLRLPLPDLTPALTPTPEQKNR